MASKKYVKSHPTGLTKGETINLVDPATGGSSSKTIYKIIESSVSGRTSWEGKRVYDCDTGKHSWQSTKGQRGPRKGKIMLKQPGKDPKEATFSILWEPSTYTEVDRCTIPGRAGHQGKKGKKQTMHWIMNVTLAITLDTVTYEKSINLKELKQQCKCRPV